MKITRFLKPISRGAPLKIETGKIAQLANGACFVRYGDTVVNVAVTASAKPRDGIDFSRCPWTLRKAIRRGQNSRLLPEKGGPSQR